VGSPPPRERKDGTLKVLLGTVLALVTLIAVSAVVLVMSQSRVSTHINRRTSQNSNSNTYQSGSVGSSSSSRSSGSSAAGAQPTPVPTPSSAAVDGLPANTYETGGIYDMYCGNTSSGDFPRVGYVLPSPWVCSLAA